MTVTARPATTARPRPPAPPTRSYYDCWVEAGGGTVLFDADRYMALMREAGILRPPVPLSEVLSRVAERQAAPKADLEGFGRILVDELGREGYRIHSISKCIRLSDEVLTAGRPMTPAEEQTLLLPQSPRPSQEDGEDPGAGAPTFEHVTPEGDRFLVPEGWTPGDKSSRCRSCDALILWAVTPRNKRAPVDPDGRSHFSSCPDAASWRKKA
jgi:hypothetical protein